MPSLTSNQTNPLSLMMNKDKDSNRNATIVTTKNSNKQQVNNEERVEMNMVGLSKPGRLALYEKVAAAIDVGAQFRSTAKELKPLFKKMVEDYREALNHQSKVNNDLTGNTDALQKMLDEKEDELKSRKEEIEMQRSIIADQKHKLDVLIKSMESNREDEDKIEKLSESIRTNFPPLDQSYSAALNNNASQLGNNHQHFKSRRRDKNSSNKNEDNPYNERRMNREIKKQKVIVIKLRETSLLKEQELFNKVNSLIKPIDKEVNFSEVNLNKSGKVIIGYQEESHHQLIMDSLTPLNEEIESNMIKNKKAILIKGIPNFVEEEEIRDALSSTYKIDEIHKIKLIQNPSFKYNRCTVILNEKDAYDLYKEEFMRLGYKNCSIEANTRPLQCINCLKFNHSAYREGKLVCRNDAKCLECGGDHQTKHHNSDEATEISGCSNCKSKEHKSNDKNCPIYQKIIKT